MNDNYNQEGLINALKERAKELNCLYMVQETLKNSDEETEKILTKIIEIIPPGWQYPEVTVARIEFEGMILTSKNFVKTQWYQKSDFIVMDKPVGFLEVYYTEERPLLDEGPFLKEERRLIQTISELISAYFFHKQLKSVFENSELKSNHLKSEWFVIIDLLKKTDIKLLIRISKKMVNFMIFKGFKEAESLFDYFVIKDDIQSGESGEKNYPSIAISDKELLDICDKIFNVASDYLEESEIVSKISDWIKEDQTNFLISILGNSGSTLEQIGIVVERYTHLKNQGLFVSPIRDKFIKSSLIRRVLSGQKEFLKIALKFIQVEDLYAIFNNIIHPANSFGKLGGKSSGIILAKSIFERSRLKNKQTQNVKFPKTWYMSSDCFFYFMRYNNIEEIAIHKYKEIAQVKKEYPYVNTIFKNSVMPPDIEKSLKALLVEFEGKPLIVRSTSLLEDRQNAIFAGKYKSLFISNIGTESERYEELANAIAEVYASIFGPDPIEYRRERGLLCYNEEMAIMIQEVIGSRNGKYYFPLFSGVGFSKNNYKWSARLGSDDGLLRLVPGLGTRAVDRVSNDYPILVAPKNPDIKVNVSIQDIIKYSPKYMDVINLETKKIETININDFLVESGYEVLNIHYLLSEISEKFISPASKIGFDFNKKFYSVTFDNLINKTDFIEQITSVLNVLQQEFDSPVDIEFAHDGKDLYLLQSRLQSMIKPDQRGLSPLKVNMDSLVFSTHNCVSNGNIANISHIVYVNSLEYSRLTTQEDLLEIGKIVGSLNKMLPMRQFILMGPGRWGSRGDIKLGVPVVYSDINNTSLLIELAFANKDFEPEFSFGTHFFQDLVEAGIYYLPIHIGDSHTFFNEEFFVSSDNILGSLLPDAVRFEKVVKVIDVAANNNGKFLNVLMDESKGEAFAFIDKEIIASKSVSTVESSIPTRNDIHWRWRLNMVEKIAKSIDYKTLGVKNLYVFGSTKNATASAGSDIDILIHFIGDENQKQNLLYWLAGWDSGLAHINYQRTGYYLDKILDIHIITDEDIANKTSYAIKIGASSDGARLLPMNTSE